MLTNRGGRRVFPRVNQSHCEQSLFLDLRQNDLDCVDPNLPEKIKHRHLADYKFFCLFVWWWELSSDWLYRWPGRCDWSVLAASCCCPSEREVGVVQMWSVTADQRRGNLDNELSWPCELSWSILTLRRSGESTGNYRSLLIYTGLETGGIF